MPRVPESYDDLLDTLRGRILRGLHAGALSDGDRLPSARDLVAEFEVDHRTILAAYRKLAEEGLVELRPRGGIYVLARSGGSASSRPMPVEWVVEFLSAGFAREIAAAELHDWLRRATETLRLRAAVITSTSDQVSGLCRELSDDFGLEVDGVVAEEMWSAPQLPLVVRRADVIVTTEAHATRVQRLGAELGKPVILLEVRLDLVAGEWALLLRRPVYVVVATTAFADIVRRFFAGRPGVENLRVLVFGQDDVSAIPPGAPTYVTRRVRAGLGDVEISGRILPPARTVSTRTARELFAFIVSANLTAMGRRS